MNSRRLTIVLALTVSGCYGFWPEATAPTSVADREGAGPNASLPPSSGGISEGQPPQGRAGTSGEKGSPANLTVYDPSTHETDPHLLRVAGPEGDKLVRLTFSRYLKDESQCPGSEHTLDQARTLGAVVPRTTSGAEGSFTSTAKQRAYVMAVGECGASGADNYGTGLLIVRENGRTVARAEIAGNEYLERVLDIDQDGQHEILLVASFNQGVEVSHARLVRLDGTSGLSVIQDFGQVGENNCAFDEDETYDNYSVIRARVIPGKAPEFDVEKHQGRCE